ncbi:MAG: MFS transporter [Bacteroidales bacterium]|nr:MFS transporter [Bacteroidales bacterium]
MSNKKSVIIPVLFAFIVMGFGDIVGVITGYAKEQFALSNTVASLVPMAIFVWFLFLSVPTAVLMNKIGRKKMVNISIVLTFLGLIIPLIHFNLATFFIVCILLGIGNSIIQVALNPLLQDAAGAKGSLSSYISAGQVLKALSGASAAFMAQACINMAGSWKYMFPAYALIALIAFIWLRFTAIEETPVESDKSIAQTFVDAFKLLGNRYILYCFLGIFFVVGLDVGMNYVSPGLLAERSDMADPSFGCTVYLICKMIGAFVGAFLLSKMADRTFFKIAIIIVACALAGLFFVRGQWPVLALIGVIGFFSASVFSIIISLGINNLPEKANEISGLMIMGIVGGAIVSLLMGITADSMGSQLGSLVIIAVCVAYLALCAFVLLREKKA